VVIRVIVAMAVLVWAVNVNALTVNTKAQKPKGYGMAGIKDLFSQITTLIDGTKMDNILRDEYGLSNETLNNYASTVAGIESDGGQNLENPDSTAKGVYQFTDAGFKTAVQRAKNVYEAKGYTVPLWLEKAEETGVMGLNEAQQKDLFFANLQQNPDPTMDLLKKYEEGDNKAGYDLYAKYHHTKPDKATKDRAYKFFGIDS